MQQQFIIRYAIVLILLLLCPIRADTAEAKVEWRMASAFPGSAFLLGSQRRFTQVLDVSEGMLGHNAAPGWLARNLPVEKCKRC